MRFVTTFAIAADEARILSDLNGAPVQLWQHPATGWFTWTENPEQEELIDAGFVDAGIVEPSASAA